MLKHSRGDVRRMTGLSCYFGPQLSFPEAVPLTSVLCINVFLQKDGSMKVYFKGFWYIFTDFPRPPAPVHFLPSAVARTRRRWGPNSKFLDRSDSRLCLPGLHLVFFLFLLETDKKGSRTKAGPSTEHAPHPHTDSGSRTGTWPRGHWRTVLAFICGGWKGDSGYMLALPTCDTAFLVRLKPACGVTELAHRRLHPVASFTSCTRCDVKSLRPTNPRYFFKN